MHDVIRSDDQAAMHRFVYRGPADFPLWSWQIPQWFVGALVLFALQVSLLFTRPNVWIGLALFIVIHPALAFYIGGPLTRRALHHETGLGYWVRTFYAEVYAPRATEADQARTALPASLFVEETAPVRSALPTHLLPSPEDGPR